MEKVLPLKRFGQNYLTDNNILNKIVDEINPGAEDLIVEIGPGRGALTEKLNNYEADIIAVEIDKRVKEELNEKFPDIKILNEDFIKTNLYQLVSSEDRKIRLAGNIPYNLTSPIIFKMT